MFSPIAASMLTCLFERLAILSFFQRFSAFEVLNQDFNGAVTMASFFCDC
jgi:hypothetical protein